MSQTTQYPMNFYSRGVTNASGTSDAYLYFLCHADRSTVSAGTWFVDHSSWDRALSQRGSGVIQTQAAAYFSTGGILFTGSTATADSPRIIWDSFDLTYGQGTGPRNAFVIDNFIKFSSLRTDGMYWFDVTATQATLDYFRAFFLQSGTAWHITLEAFRPALGLFLSHSWVLHTMATGSWMHFAVIALDSVTAVGSNRIGVFQNGSQLPIVAGGNPSAPNAGWTLCNFALSSGPFISYGGLLSLVAGTVNSYQVLPGEMDELHVVLGDVQGLSYDSLLSSYYFNVPSVPYSPADGTFNITAKVLSLGSATLSPTTTNNISLGNTGQEYANLWVAGTAYLTRVGRSFTVDGTSRINFGDATVYLFSSVSGSLSVVAGTQINLGANVAMSAVNFIFDTVTGVKFGTTTNVKMGWFGSTPIVQPPKSQDLMLSLNSLGLITAGTGTATPLNLNGGPFSAGSGTFSGILVVGGAFYATGHHFQVTQIGSATTSYSLTTANDVLICAGFNSTSVILPQSTLAGKIFFVKNVGTVGTVTVTIGTVASTGIDGTTTYLLSPEMATTFIDGRTILIGSGSLGAWSYRRLLTFTTDTAIAVGTQASFPALVRFTTANFNFANCRSDGGDIRFVSVVSDVALNYNKLFFGFTLDTTTNVITGSTVSGDTTGGAWATVTSVSDGNDATFGNSADVIAAHWLRFQLGAPTKVNYLRVKPYTNANGKTIKDFTFEGSNDTAGAWTVISSLYHEQNSNYESYVFTNNTAYSFYRMNFSNSWQAGTHGLIGVYEVQMYSNGTTQMGLFMVQVPTVAAGSTFYAYYGNASAVDASSSLVWDSNVAAIWPMGAFTTGSVAQTLDYSSNARHASTYIASTVYGRPNLVWNSLWGYTLAYYGSQLLSVADSSVWDDGMVNWTWTMWIVESATGGNKAYISRGSDGASYLYWGKDNGAPLRWRDYNGGPDLNAFSPAVVTNSVTMLTMKRSSNNFELYKNAASIGTASNAAALIARTTPLWLGAHTGINYFVNGSMWNVQIETVTRGTDWIKTKYYSDSDLLLTTGAESTFASVGTTPTFQWTTFNNKRDGAYYSISVQTAAFTVGSNIDVYLISASAGSMQVTMLGVTTLPNKQFIMKKVDTTGNTITMQPAATEFIDGTTQYTMISRNEAVT
jgi:hypothetical protein